MLITLAKALCFGLSVYACQICHCLACNGKVQLAAINLLWSSSPGLTQRRSTHGRVGSASETSICTGSGVAVGHRLLGCVLWKTTSSHGACHKASNRTSWLEAVSTSALRVFRLIPLSLRQPHSGTSSSISDSPIPSPITSSFDSPLCSFITPSLSLPA